MQNTISKIKNELNYFYNKNEINSLISIIIEFVTGMNNTQRLIRTDYVFNDEQKKQTDLIIERLKKHEPIQYIIGKTLFYDLNFHVNKSVLIPRPETEELVDWILTDNKHQKNKLEIMDIGTGSGCVAISLAQKIKMSHVTAIDISESALEIARKNAKLNDISNISFVNTDILNEKTLKFETTFDIIVSNPPYVTIQEFETMPQNVKKHEPHLALFVENKTPLIFYEAIAHLGKKYLKSGGALYFEINEKFGNEMIQMLHTLNYHDITLKKDINNKDRMIRAFL